MVKVKLQCLLQRAKFLSAFESMTPCSGGGALPGIEPCPPDCSGQDSIKHLKLGSTTHQGHFSPYAKGAFAGNRAVPSLFQNPGAHAPSDPWFL